jgi:ParB-like chromosome segregation protein Spo0J
MKMLVELKNLKPNPFRDFAIDPINDGVVAALESSISEYGFWGGVVCRKGKNGDIEIGAGHHRVHAAMKSGIRAAGRLRRRVDDPRLRNRERDAARQFQHSSRRHSGKCDSLSGEGGHDW